MYKKLTAFLLIFILLFNFITIEHVKAEAITLGTAFLVFAGLITATGVTVTSINDMKSLYSKYQVDSGTEFTAFTAKARLIYESMLDLGSNFTIDWQDTNISKLINWVKNKFSVGYNQFEIEGVDNIEVPNSDYSNLPLNELIRSKSYPIMEGEKVTWYMLGSRFSAYFSGPMYPDDPSMYRYRKMYIDVDGEHRILTVYYNQTPVSVRSTAYYRGNRIEYHIYYGSYSTQYNKYLSENPPIKNPTEEEKSKLITYVGSDVLTNPTYEPPKDIFPPPPVYLPGIESTPQGRVYTGTPGQLAEELENNNQAVEDMVKKYIGQNTNSLPTIGSIPTYNSGTGTISFPNTTVDNPAWDIPVDTPWDIPIDVPVDIPVPADVPTGLGVIGWLLHYLAQGITSIWNWLTNLFTAPTKQVSFDSMMNLNFKDKFPFCLPWDLYNSVAIISATPEVPIFQTSIKNVPIKIDFTQFEDLAKIVRWASTLIYSISLIMISRRLIGGE